MCDWRHSFATVGQSVSATGLNGNELATHRTHASHMLRRRHKSRTNNAAESSARWTHCRPINAPKVAKPIPQEPNELAAGAPFEYPIFGPLGAATARVAL